jgi:hypothetical protein
MRDWIREDGLAWRPLTPFGVEIVADLSEPLERAKADRAYALLRDGGLILARGQA